MRELGESKQTVATVQSKVPFVSYPRILMKPYMGVMQIDRLLSSILSFSVQVNELEKDVQRKEQELTRQCQSVMNDLADVERSKTYTEDQLREKKSEVIAVINRANAKPCESICTERI